MQNYRFVKGYLFVIAAMIIWSGNFIVARILADTVPPVTLTVLRSVIASIVLLPFVMNALRSEMIGMKKHLGYLVVTAFLGVTASNTFLYIAAATSNALNMSLIAIFAPVLTILFARLFLRDTLTMRRVVGLVAATSGVILLVTKGQFSSLSRLTFSEGDLWMLGQATSFAAYSILLRKKPAGLQPLTFLFSLFVLGLLLPFPWFIQETIQHGLIEFSPSTVVALLYLGLGPSLLAYLCWNQSVAIIGPTRAAFVYYCLPLFSGAEALLLLGEPVYAIHVVSGILILGGVIFATTE
ncbi:DMT family transporter [Desulfomonile tiedjei]|uniref:Putative permease n=1 Tax=Desulfomonile tiedjei (strain ATCC 49306 / DSM 6799 / DCB-1) TaxID=706587 RepID=I4C3N6_DESTA|nr:DMT family transporter [Desulfomonile tiedjei]AFM24177.1 putative permease [Desulfomonile tiedjei DSM 6799]